MNPPPRRSDDDVRLFRRVFSVIKYPGLWIALGALGAALGFGVVTPKRTADEVRAEMHGMIDSTAIRGARADARLQGQIDSMNALRIELAHQHQSLETAVTALVRMECVNPMVTNGNKLLSGIVDGRGFCIR